MCGIFGYVGRGDKAAQIVLEGLRKLEYRGYDSWGIALLNQKKNVSSGNTKIKSQKLVIEKHVGAIGEATLDSKFLILNSNVAIGHTRWATHGGVTESNAHPHYSSGKNFVVAQNGIVENFEELKRKLAKKGYKFTTETDTEVIVRLIESKLERQSNKETGRESIYRNQKEAVRLAFKELDGRNTIIVLVDDGRIIACRNGSPLVVGKNDGDIFVSSDTLSFSDKAKTMMVLDNGQMLEVVGKKLNIFDIKSGKKAEAKFEKVQVHGSKVGKGGFSHYMVKEIHEIPKVVENLISQNHKQLFELAKEIKNARQVYTIGSGTTGIAAAQIAYFLKHFAKVNAIALVGADAYECYDLFGKGDLIIAPSQSGETADVLEVLEIAKKKGVKVASNVNMPGSMMTKMSDFKFMTQAGPEICVVSTKVFVAHIAWGYLLAKVTADDGSKYSFDKAQDKYEVCIKELRNLADAIEEFLKDKKSSEQIKKLAKILLPKENIYLLGKAQNFQIVREGMVKLIETSYKHAHAMPAGDLKHYAITLMEKGVPVIVAISNDSVKGDVLNAVSQIKARGAYVIGIGPENGKEFDFYLNVPDLGDTSSIFNVIPLQLLAYYMAVGLGNNVDRPRNIAKSVTVK